MILILLFFLLVAPSHASMYEMINRERSSYELSPLKFDVRLERSAMIKACDINNRGYWSHKDPEGRMPWYLFIQVGYRYQSAGENLAKNFKNDRLAMIALMRSPSHRENILDPLYKDIGIAKCGRVIVQHFGNSI